MNVLIVDDEPLARGWLSRLLQRVSGVRVCGEVANGDEALEKALALPPDLVLLDIHIPGRDGDGQHVAVSRRYVAATKRALGAV